MKKLVSLILALVLILSLCTAAFATEGEGEGESTSTNSTISNGGRGTSEISYSVTGKNSYIVTYPGSYAFDSTGVAPAAFSIDIYDLEDTYDGVQLSLISSKNSFKLVNGSTSLTYGFVASADKNGTQFTEEKDGATVNTTKTLAAEDVFLITTFNNKTMENTNKTISLNVTITDSINNIPHGTYLDTVTFRAEPREDTEDTEKTTEETNDDSKYQMTQTTVGTKKVTTRRK